MRFTDKVQTAWSNLGRRKVRTALTSIGVVVGITTIVTMISLVNGVHAQVARQFEKIGLDRVVVRPRMAESIDFFGFGDRAKKITPADVERWRQWPEVKRVAPEIDLPNGAVTRLQLGKASGPVRVAGGSSLRRGPFAEPLTVVEGSIDLPDSRGAVVLSRGWLKKMKVPGTAYKSMLGQTAQLTLLAPRGEQQKYPLKVIGISSENAAVIQVSVGTRLQMKSWWNNDPNVLQSEGYDSVSLRTADVSQAKLVVDKLKQEKLFVQSIDAILDAANKIFVVVTSMLTMVTGVALLVACIGITNTMIMSIYERTREIGTLKAMGASASDIRQMFVLEAGMIGFLGGSFGLFFGWLLGRVLNRIALWYAVREKMPLPENLFIITPGLALSAVLFAVFIGILAGLYPANRAAKLDPLRALRHE